MREPAHARILDLASAALLLLGVAALAMGAASAGYVLGVDRGAASAAAALRWCGPCRVP